MGILVYGYATGVFSSRKLERATYDSVAFRYIAAGSHPDHDTLAAFRRRFLVEVVNVFMQVLELAKEMHLLTLGTISLDGTKIQANASRHSALSHGHIEKLEAQLKAEVQELLALAEQADGADIPDGVSLPDEIKCREDRLPVMADAPRGPRSAFSARRRTTKGKWRGAPPGKKRPGKNWGANFPRRPNPVRKRATRST